MKHASYLIFALAGGLAGWLANSSAPPSGTTPKRASPSENTMARPDGDALLEDFMTRNTPKPAENGKPPEDSMIGRFEKLRAKAPASADPEADFKALLAEFSKTGSDARVGMKQVPEIGVMFSQWLERDDRAALAYIAEAYQQPGPSRIVTVRWRSIRR